MLVTLRLALIGVLVLALCIPLFMLYRLVNDRQERYNAVLRQMGSAWGNPQTLAGPYIKHAGGVLVPVALKIEGDLKAEVRRKGIYKISFYTASLVMTGSFPAKNTAGALFVLPVGDKRSVLLKSLKLNGIETDIDDKSQAEGLFEIPTGAVPAQFRLELQMQGIEKLHFLASSPRTSVTLRSNWKDPNFSGAYLPTSRKIDSTGFEATWDIVSAIHKSVFLQVPAAGAEKAPSRENEQLEGDAGFGVHLFLPVDIYQQVTRAVKYGVLFIALTFLMYFLFEILSGMRIHPMQYLLVGLALCIFYLLLLSLSEQIPFLVAYLVSALATIGLITGYSTAVLKRKKNTAILAFFLVLLYSFLYSLLQLEEYSLLLGSIGLFLILAGVMYMTRNIAWYEAGAGAK